MTQTVSHNYPSGRYRQLDGPSLDQPFQVGQGFVLVELVNTGRLLITAGMSWPGLENLHRALIDHLQPSETRMAPGTVIWQSSDLRAIEQGKALILTQALTSVGVLSERVLLAEAMGIPIREMSRYTAAGLLNTTRETISAALRVRP